MSLFTYLLTYLLTGEHKLPTKLRQFLISRFLQFLQQTDRQTHRQKPVKITPASHCIDGQGLKYNFKGGGTVQLSRPPNSFVGPPLISWAHVLITVFQII